MRSILDYVEEAHRIKVHILVKERDRTGKGIART